MKDVIHRNNIHYIITFFLFYGLYKKYRYFSRYQIGLSTFTHPVVLIEMDGNTLLISRHSITVRNNLPITFEEDVGSEDVN